MPSRTPMNITNIGDLRKCQSFVVHAERSRLLRQQTVKSFQAYARVFVYVNAVTPVTCVDNILMNSVFK